MKEALDSAERAQKLLTMGAGPVSIMIAGILLPSVKYSLFLSDPRPEQLLVAMCIMVFSSTVSLWLLDVTGMVSFRYGWVSKSIWSAAILSILGTGVGVFRGALADRPHALEGEWKLTISTEPASNLRADTMLIVLHRRDSESYSGYSDYKWHAPPESDAVWTALNDLSETGDRAQFTLFMANGERHTINTKLKPDGDGRFVSDESGYTITLRRPW